MHCSQCGNALPADGSFCKHCGARAMAASPRCFVHCAGVCRACPGLADTKICRFCGEMIQAVAIKCRYCNSDLTAAQPGGINVQAPPQSGAAGPSIVIQNVQSGPAAGQQFVPREIKNPGIALLLSFIFPGGGQFYNVHAGKGIIVLLTFWTIVPLIWSYFDAYSSANRINRVGF